MKIALIALTLISSIASMTAFADETAKVGANATDSKTGKPCVQSSLNKDKNGNPVADATKTVTPTTATDAGKH